MKSSTIRKIGSLFLVGTMLFGCAVDNSDTADDNNTTDNSDSGDTTDDNGTTDNSDTSGDTSDTSDNGDIPTLYGAAAVDQTADYTVEQMLTYAIQDEYLAHEEYTQIIAQYGEATPFANIVKAEENHIDALTRMFETYNYEVPADLAKSYVELPGTLLAAYQAGVDAEILNIGMYEFFLTKELPDDVRTVFESLKSASNNHLEAFNLQVSKYNT